MKNINKIIGIIGLLFCVLQPISAQFRMGIDWSCGMPKSYFYSTRYYDDEGTYMPTAHAGFSSTAYNATLSAAFNKKWSLLCSL